MSQVMNISRALAEIKRIDDRVTRLTNESVFVAVVVGKDGKQKMNTGNESVQQVASKMQSAFDKIQAEIAMRAKIKAAVVKSNAVTEITLGGTIMTIAEAIELKKSIQLKKALCAQMQRQLMSTRTTVDILNGKLEQQIEANLATIYGSDKSKVDASTFEMVSKPQREAKEASLLDPLKLETKIEQLNEEISAVETELDYLLSTQNAVTTISV
jgi:hypothetical protein